MGSYAWHEGFTLKFKEKQDPEYAQYLAINLIKEPGYECEYRVLTEEGGATAIDVHYANSKYDYLERALAEHAHLFEDVMWGWDYENEKGFTRIKGGVLENAPAIVTPGEFSPLIGVEA